jgi:ABC-type siderophore export system fused ATPase/permease subunit
VANAIIAIFLSVVALAIGVACAETNRRFRNYRADTASEINRLRQHLMEAEREEKLGREREAQLGSELIKIKTQLAFMKIARGEATSS